MNFEKKPWEGIRDRRAGLNKKQNYTSHRSIIPPLLRRPGELFPRLLLIAVVFYVLYWVGKKLGVHKRVMKLMGKEH
eukprot:8774919-Pyramimonas_sp.AAC.1